MSEELFAAARGNMRLALGIIFILFIICFVAIIIEETFLGGRRRRRAEKQARERAEAKPPTSDHAPQS
jgi:ABC-type Fe3+ transport system permease subunit